MNPLHPDGPAEAGLLDERLHDYLDGRLSPAERASFERVLEADAALASALDLLRAAARAVCELPLVAPPVSLRDSIAGAIRNERVPSAGPVGVYRRIQMLNHSLLAASLVGAMLVGGAILVSQGPEDAGTSTLAVAVRPREPSVPDVIAYVGEGSSLPEGALAVLRNDSRPELPPGDLRADRLRKHVGELEEAVDRNETQTLKDMAEELAKDFHETPQESPNAPQAPNAARPPKKPGATAPESEKQSLEGFVERSRQLRLQEQQKSQAKEPGSTADSSNDAPSQMGGREPADRAAPVAPGKAGGGGRVHGPAGSPTESGDLDTTKKRSDEAAALEGAKAFGNDGATPPGGPAPKADQVDEKRNKLEDKRKLGENARQPESGGRGEGAAHGEANGAWSQGYAKDREARDADKSPQDFKPPARASSRPLGLVATDPERLAALLQAHAERNGLAIRRERVADGWVVELDDLSLTQVERLRAATRELAAPEGGAREYRQHAARDGLAARSQAERAELKRPAAPVPENAAAPDPARVPAKPSLTQSSSGSEGALASRTNPPAPPSDAQQGDDAGKVRPPQADPSTAEPPKAATKSLEQAEVERLRRSEARGNPNGDGGSALGDGAELRAGRLGAALQDLRTLERALAQASETAIEAKKELLFKGNHNESTNDDAPRPRYSLRIVIRRP